MTDRRSFLKLAALGSVAPAPLLAACASGGNAPQRAATATVNRPVVVSTWDFGLPANAAAWEILSRGGCALDAVEAGARVPEGDPTVQTVGHGGFPDREGNVTLDASIMNERGDCGSVAALQHIMHPISVARLVMEQTPHVMLVGAGALEFALAHGFPRDNLLTPASEQAWREWIASEEKREKSEINIENRPRGGADNHDTIGMLALDANGDLSGACTTSGAAWKLPGRVGDSPIIGAGLYVDNAVGGACATGWGEAVVRIVGSHLVVEFMRQGHAPDEACRLAVERVIEKNPDYQEIQVGFLALDKQGAFGAYAIQPGFNYAAYDEPRGNRLIDAQSRL